MAGKTPRSYADALAAVSTAQADAARARLTDPGEHFPYHKDDALAALRAAPAEGTNDHPAHWYTSEAIIDATAAYVEAEEAYIKDPGDATKEAYRVAADELVAARQTHRRGRPVAPVAVAGAPNEIEERQSMVRALAKSGWDAGRIASMTGRPIAEVQGALAGLED